MKFIVHTENDYIYSLELSTKDEAVEVPEEIQTSQYIICYKYKNGVFTFDEEKKKEIDNAPQPPTWKETIEEAIDELTIAILEG